MGSSPIRVASFASVAQSVEQGTENPRVVGSIPTGGTTIRGFSSFGRARPCQGRGGGFEPRNPLQKMGTTKTRALIFIRRHSQVVRQRSAKPLRPSSNLGGASKAPRTIRSWGLLLTYYLFTLTLNGRIFWEVIGKRKEVISEVAFRGGEKHFYCKG